MFLLEFALKNVRGWSYMKVTCFLKSDSDAEWMKSHDTEVSVRFNRQFLKEERLVLDHREFHRKSVAFLTLKNIINANL